MDRLQAGDPGQIGPFRLLGRLGEGGTGQVFLGASAGDRKVAVKVVHSHYASDPEFRARFAGEVASARQVGGFRTALVVDADPDADPPWIATAYIPGSSLAETIARRGPLGEAGLRKVGAALAEGVTAIHACGLIHRDLKPSNVILARGGLRITGFGIARGTDTTTLTASHAVSGTLRYMSPEQLHAQELTPQSDVFAIGAILAYAATGHDPHDAPSVPALITSILSDPPNLEPLAGGLHDIIGSCLAKNPGDRPTPADLLALFSPAAPGTTQAPPPASATGNGPDPAARETRTQTRSPAAGPPAPQQPAVLGTEARRRRRRRTTTLAAVITTAAGLTALTALGVSLSGRHSPSPTGAQRSPSSNTQRSPSSSAQRSSSGSGQHSGSSPPGTARPTATLIHPADTIPNWVAFGPGGTLATTDDNSGNTYLWNTDTGQLTATLADPRRTTVNSAAFGPGGVLAIADVSGRTYLWNIRTGRVTATLADPTGAIVNSAAFGPGGVLATADDSGRTYLWNIRTGRVTATLTDPDSKGVLSVAFGPGGTLATADFNRSTYLWNTATDQVTAALADPRGVIVNSAAFGPGGTLATADVSGRTYLWNIRTGRVTATLTDPNSKGVLSVAFGLRGTLATGDYNGNTYLWNVPA